MPVLVHNLTQNTSGLIHNLLVNLFGPKNFYSFETDERSQQKKNNNKKQKTKGSKGSDVNNDS